MIEKEKLINTGLTLLMIPFIFPRDWTASALLTSVMYNYKYLAGIAILLYASYRVLAQFCHVLLMDDRAERSDPASSFVFLLWIAYYVWYVLDTALQLPDQTVEVIKNCIPELAFLYLVNYWAGRNREALLRSVSWIFTVMTTVNLLFAVAAPSFFGITDNDGRYIYLLGERNALAFFLIPGMTVVLLYGFLYPTAKILAVYMTVISLVTIILSGSATAIATVMIFVLLLILGMGQYRVRESLLCIDWKARTLAILYLAIWILLVVLQSTGFLTFFVENILGRTSTFTNRTLIWSESILLILQAPLMGYGGYYVQHIRLFVATYYTCHNFILQNLVDAGLISVVMLAGILGITIHKIDSHPTDGALKILKIGLLAVFITLLMEAYTFHYGSLLTVLILRAADDRWEPVQNSGESVWTPMGWSL